STFGKCLNPPLILTQPSNQTVTAGNSASVAVTASGSLPLACQWQFNGNNLAGATNASLSLDNVQPVQAGNYTAIVTNAAGIATSSNAVLTVNVPVGCVSPPPGLVSWWSAEGNGSDQAGSNNGTPVNG